MMAAFGRFILAADVVGYSSLIQRNEKGTRERLEAYRHFLYPRIAENRGRVVGAPGDSLLAGFDSPIEAVRCAVEVQRGLILRNTDTPLDGNITFRIGIHECEVMPSGEDLVSRAVAALPIDTVATLIKPRTEIHGGNTALRVAGLAGPGGICISGTVRDAIGDVLPYTFEDIGRQNIGIGAAPVHCYAMDVNALAAAPRVMPQSQSSSATQDEVRAPASRGAALPPRATSQKLALTAGVVVTIAVWIAAGSAFLAYFHHPASKSAKSVADDPTPVAIPAQTVQPPPGPISDLPHSSETQAAPERSPPPSAVTPPLRITDRSGDDKEPADPPARKLITHGRALYQQPYNFVRWQEARSDFQRALELDSQSSEARIGLASILSTKLADGWSPVLQEDVPGAERLLQDAVDVGRASDRAAAYFTFGVLRQMQNRLPEARSEFEAAISLDPDDARTHLHLGETLMYLGEPEAGIPRLEQAIRLSPDSPNLAMAYWVLGTCQLLLGRVDEAIDLLQTARAANVRLWVPYFYLAGAYGLKGDLDKARSALAESLDLKPALRSVARMRAENPWLSNPQYWALQEKTLNLGLRSAGFPDQ